METTFEQQLERPVKSVLADFPALGDILGEALKARRDN